ncbi:MAG: ABC transporter ATP-binding protein [Oscillospiraceae bacterium]|jgi:branched-chain amino acid transport system ATP-binding protein|nr:ABC transporter ATP-binding protein [Oscillospiraceae bacterium]
MSENVILKVEGLETRYEKEPAIHNISFEVREGQVVTLLGSNGVGKSTVLKTISGIVTPAAGKVIFCGEDITSKPAHEIVKRGLVHVPEGRKIFKDLTVTENLELGAYNMKDKHERKRRMNKVFERFPVLGSRKKQMGGTLSGGEQQMLAIGRGLMSEPKLLLMDEPSMGIAPLIVRDITDIIRNLHRDGTTILLVEQNAKMALGLADYGYVLDTGRIVLEGKGADLRNDDKVVKAYLGG